MAALAGPRGLRFVLFLRGLSMLIRRLVEEECLATSLSQKPKAHQK